MRSAISCGGRSFSRPSGIIDLPVLVNSSIWLRRSACDLPSTPTNVTLVLVSLAIMPLSVRPSLVIAR